MITSRGKQSSSSNLKSFARSLRLSQWRIILKTALQKLYKGKIIGSRLHRVLAPRLREVLLDLLRKPGQFDFSGTSSEDRGVSFDARDQKPASMLQMPAMMANFA